MTQDTLPGPEHEGTVLPDTVESRPLPVRPESVESGALLFGEPTLTQDVSAPITSPGRFAVLVGTLLGRDDWVGVEPRVRSGANLISTLIMIAIGGALGVVAVIDALGGDSNDMALGTGAVALCFIVAVLAEAMLDSPRAEGRSRRGRTRQFRR